MHKNIMYIGNEKTLWALDLNHSKFKVKSIPLPNIHKIIAIRENILLF